jgi:glycosyltransferase involved in cell wall biosynthesis
MCGLAGPITATVISPLLPEPPVTGGQKRTLRLLEAMERAGLHPHLISPDSGAADAAQRLRGRGWTVDVVSEPPPPLAARVRQHLARRPSPLLPELADRFVGVAAGSALVQFEHTQSAYYAVPAGVPHVLSLHNLDSAVATSSASQRRFGGVSWLRDQNRAAALRVVERRVFPLADRVLVVSREDAAAVSAAGGRPLLAPNGVDDEFFRVPAGDTGERALFFGHFGYEANRRGLERFLAEGWPAIAGARPSARLAVAGGGMDRALRERLAATAGVEVLGLVADLPGVLAAARAVVVPIWEGGGTRLKVVEAMAAGRAIVSTPLGASGVGFEPGRHGLVADTPRGLADALSGLLSNAPRAAVLGAAGRQHAERYRWATTLSGASALYAEIVARRRAGGT